MGQVYLCILMFLMKAPLGGVVVVTCFRVKKEKTPARPTNDIASMGTKQHKAALGARTDASESTKKKLQINTRESTNT